jgi:oligosaccharyltransferase complex subunit gamma
MMVSGHMFNQIRHPSFMAQEKSGKVKVWHQGFQDQYGVESQIIALVCKYLYINL